MYCAITVIIVLLPIIFNPTSVDTIKELGYYNKPRWIDLDLYGAFMTNTEGLNPEVLYFRQIDLFSDLSRNSTSSSSSPTSSNNLFENEDPEVQGNSDSDLEIEGLTDGSTLDVNQTSTPSSPSSNELFEPEESAEFQNDFEANTELNSGNGVSTREFEGNSDNSSLTNP